MARRKKQKTNDRFILIISSILIIIAIVLITAYLTKYDKGRYEKKNLKRVYTPYAFKKTMDNEQKKRIKRKSKKGEKSEDYVRKVKVLVEDFLFLSNIGFSEEVGENYTKFSIKVKDSEYSLVVEKMRVFTGRKSISLKIKKLSSKKLIWYLFKDSKIVAEINVVIIKTEKKRLVKYPKVAIVIDDIGNSKDVLNKLSRVTYKFAISILPNSMFRDYAIKIGKKSRKQIMLHLPMEPVKRNGDRMNLDGFLLVSMRDDVIRNFTEEYLDLIPQAVGVNNHTGSLFTQYRNKMRIVLEVLKRKNKFFIDSKTSSKTIAYELAKEMGLRAGIRDVFLDSENERITILNFKHLFSIAKHKGEAIGICHPNETTISVLMHRVESLAKAYKIKLVYPSEIVK